ncbi:MAG: hypothetical protein V3V72_13425 [Ignavibacteriaceae bacterium]
MKRLTELHPLMKKLRALEAYMDQQKISVEWNGYDMQVTDTETNEAAYLKDCDNGEALTELPYMMETKLIRY